ncbi:MAG: two-component system regulatory protein YycI [Aerococcus sp.]|nr:two-component system regulatory protein YycI [Aerococcus sp.]
MDFRKIEYFLIAAFLMLDLFLLYVFVGKNTTLLTASQTQTNINVMEEMRNKNMTLNFQVNNETKHLAMMAAKVDTINVNEADQSLIERPQLEDNDTRLFAQFEEPVTLSDLNNQKDPKAFSDNDKKQINQLLSSGAIIHGADYQLAYYDSSQGIIYCNQKIPNQQSLGIQDSSAQLLLHVNKNQQIISFEQTHVSDIKPQGDERTVISQQEAIESLYLSNQIAKDSTLYQAEPNYQSTLVVDNIIVYRPIWQVSIGGNEHALMVEFVDGINGNVIQSSSMSTDTSQNATSTTDQSQKQTSTTKTAVRWSDNQRAGVHSLTERGRRE